MVRIYISNWSTVISIRRKWWPESAKMTKENEIQYKCKTVAECEKKLSAKEIHCVWAITTAMTTTTTVAATRRFDYKIIILHFLLHRSHCSGQTKVIWMLFNAIESTRENGHKLHNPWFKFIISRWCVVDDDDGMEDDLRQFFLFWTCFNLEMLVENFHWKLVRFFFFVTFNSSHRKRDSFSGCQKSF